MIARPKISRNERKTTEIGAFEVGNFAPFCCPGEHALHEKLKADTQRRLKKRRKEEREERKAQPAYERQSMHGQKIAISVGPCSLPENMRTTYSSIPRADTKWK